MLTFGSKEVWTIRTAMVASIAALEWVAESFTLLDGTIINKWTWGSPSMSAGKMCMAYNSAIFLMDKL